MTLELNQTLAACFSQYLSVLILCQGSIREEDREKTPGDLKRIRSETHNREPGTLFSKQHPILIPPQDPPQPLPWNSAGLAAG